MRSELENDAISLIRKVWIFIYAPVGLGANAINYIWSSFNCFRFSCPVKSGCRNHNWNYLKLRQESVITCAPSIHTAFSMFSTNKKQLQSLQNLQYLFFLYVKDLLFINVFKAKTNLVSLVPERLNCRDPLLCNKDFERIWSSRVKFLPPKAWQELKSANNATLKGSYLTSC